MGDLILTIVLPCYNVENYIQRCFDSLLNQKLNSYEFEIIAINDCSTDNSKFLLQKQYDYNNIKIIDHINNKGLGASRNTGLRNAKGKYTWFIDPDDYIANDCFEHLINLLERNNLDILSFNFCNVDKNGKILKTDKIHDRLSAIMNGKEFLNRHYTPSTFSSCSKIYRTEYIINENLFFEEGVYWEDADFVVKALYFAKRVMYIPDFLYYYCFNQQSISKMVNAKTNADMVKMGYRKLIFSEQIMGQSIELSKKISNDAAWNATVVKKILFFNHSERLKFYKLINESKYFKIKNLVKNKSLRFLYFYPNFCIYTLFYLSPILKFLRKILK